MRVWSVVLALLAPAPAVALSCMPHSLEATYQRAAEADEAYVVVHGKLRFDKRLLPKLDTANQRRTPPMTRIPAQLMGRSLSRSGFNLPFDRDVMLEIACYGPWCASASTGQDVLAFVRRGPEGYVVATNPCGGDLFGTPQAGMIRKVQACFRGAECVPKRR